MLTKAESRDKVIIEYQLKDNIVRVIKDVSFTKRYGLSIIYLFQFKNSNNDIYSTVKKSKTIRRNWRTEVDYKTFTYKSLNMALKHFNKAVKALKEGTNIN